jgi:hypothetical protein
MAFGPSAISQLYKEGQFSLEGSSNQGNVHAHNVRLAPQAHSSQATQGLKCTQAGLQGRKACSKSCRPIGFEGQGVRPLALPLFGGLYQPLMVVPRTLIEPKQDPNSLLGRASFGKTAHTFPGSALVAGSRFFRENRSHFSPMRSRAHGRPATLRSARSPRHKSPTRTRSAYLRLSRRRPRWRLLGSSPFAAAP